MGGILQSNSKRDRPLKDFELEFVRTDWNLIDRLVNNSDFKERVSSEMKISNIIRLDPNIGLFSFFFFKSVIVLRHQFRPQNTTSRTCIIASRDLYYCFWGPAFSLPGPALSLPGPGLLLTDLLYFTVTSPSRKKKTSCEVRWCSVQAETVRLQRQIESGLVDIHLIFTEFCCLFSPKKV